MTSPSKKKENLSLEEVLTEVLKSDFDKNYSSIEESEEELGDFEDVDGNQVLLSYPTICMELLDPVYLQTILDNDSENEDEMVWIFYFTYH